MQVHPLVWFSMTAEGPTEKCLTKKDRPASHAVPYDEKEKEFHHLPLQVRVISLLPKFFFALLTSYTESHFWHWKTAIDKDKGNLM